MLKQYRRIKRDHRDSVLFFRLGDFYEMFSEDALEISALLNLTLTSRNGLPMCGIPYHAARSYIARLLRHGKKIAVCEQLSEPGKGLIDRKVVEIITPGTTIEEDYLDRGSSNYLAALAAAAGFYSFAYIDLSTGDFYATSFPADKAAWRLGPELERLDIREIIVSESLIEENAVVASLLGGKPGIVVNRWADWLFDGARGRERLIRQFKTASLKGFGLGDDSPEILAAGALLDYLDDTAKSLIPHVASIRVYGDSEYVGIDETTQKNLELVRNLRDGSGQFTLLEILDETKTAMGRRELKRRLLQPLRNPALINLRLDFVERLYRDQKSLAAFREILAKTPDLERLCSRLAMDRAHGKDMLSLKNALVSLERIRELLSAQGREGQLPFESAGADFLEPENFKAAAKIRKLLEQAVCENPSTLFAEGNLIREGFSPRLDELKKIKDSGRRMLEEYLEEERKATGISSLRIRYNRLIGYFLEVTKTNLSRVPSHFIRRQGVVSGERFSTERLALLESDLNGASEKIIDLERELFLDIRERAKAELSRFSLAGKLIAELDTAQSLAWAATSRGWVRPRVDGEKRFAVNEGRHPVVEAYLPSGEFIPNDLALDGGGVTFALITGPNMAGKSTYLRQAALMVIMAQMGSFVPAREALMGIADRVFCRVGASDNLARGESTFLVEMNETAHILRTATEKSLVIMDEVGRGTGTSDGLAIAWAVCEELLNRTCSRTLFATHYHELSLLSHPRLANRSMGVLEKDGEIVFLRKLKEGPAAESYGLHVAALAGLPETVLERAAALLAKLREGEAALRGLLPGRKIAAPADGPEAESRPEPGASAAPPVSTNPDAVRLFREIDAVNPDALSPLDALKTLYRWKKLFAAGRGPPERKAGEAKTRRDFGGGAGEQGGVIPSLFDGL
ncbi:MAG: DNA mismatch repair protein MutS [Treponema sp.]|jgi:DNA mismatch repair protein MutS|nr:DNA mismatch repair protein MutS [Treponema sp.]